MNLEEKYKNFITQIHEKNIEKYKDINIKEINFDSVNINEKMKKIAHKYIDNLYLNVSKLILIYKNVYLSELIEKLTKKEIKLINPEDFNNFYNKNEIFDGLAGEIINEELKDLYKEDYKKFYIEKKFYKNKFKKNKIKIRMNKIFDISIPVNEEIKKDYNTEQLVRTLKKLVYIKEFNPFIEKTINYINEKK